MAEIDAPITLTGLFGADSDESSKEEDFEEVYEEQRIEVGGQSVFIRQFSFHPKNANRIWKGTLVTADFMNQLANRVPGLKERRFLELGSATGVLAISMRKNGFTSITTSDYDDLQIQENIDHNCLLNGIEPKLHFIGHTWGEALPRELENQEFDYIIASDILLYVDSYPSLVTTLCKLMEGKSTLTMIMSWQRRMKESNTFFQLMERAGFVITDEGRRIYTICHGEQSSIAVGSVAQF